MALVGNPVETGLVASLDCARPLLEALRGPDPPRWRCERDENRSDNDPQHRGKVPSQRISP